MISDIIDSINSNITDNVSYPQEKTYGIAELHNTEGERFPAVFSGGSWNKISLDDCYDLLIYHRVDNVTSEENDTFSFGTFSNDNQETFSMLMTVVLRKPNSYQELLDLKKYIPKNITNASYAFVTTQVGEVNTNQDEIIEGEWGEIEYRRHKSDFSVFQISYEIETIVCKV